MWRWTRRLVVGLAGLLILAALSGTTYQWVAARRAIAATPPPGRLVDVGGFRLHIWCTGSGSPAVILENGLGGSTTGWGYVQPEVARFTRVCSYDRAGIGYSDPGPSPRTAARIARELENLLDRSGVPDPVVLVGASSGGFSIRMFATDRPGRVAGLVLVDASHEDQLHEVPPIARFVPVLAPIGVFRLLGISFAMNPEGLAPSVRAHARATEFRAAGYTAAASEIRNIERTANEVRATRRRLIQPVVVVTGGRNADPKWHALQRDQLTLSPRSCQIVAEDSGHVVALDRPEAVVGAIRAVIEAASGGSAPACAGR
jgi:pimeloyl-ACP methyl ester carboxylesterase